MDKVLIDTSVWIEFFRKKEPYYSVVNKLIDEDRICCSGLILAELIRGAKSEKEISLLKDFLYVFDFLKEDTVVWEKAGELSYRLRKKGISAGLSDCIIAVLASLNKVLLFTLDKDFSKIAPHIEFKIYPLKDRN